MEKYKCTVCGYIYNPDVGDADAAIKAGTSFEELPEDWTCPLCRTAKENFTLSDEEPDEIRRPESDEAARNRKIDEENIAPQNPSQINETNNEDDYDNNAGCNL